MYKELILPTSKRLHVETSLTGKGVTIGFLDGGFLAHPDMLYPPERIKAFHDVKQPEKLFSTEIVRDVSAMHGTAVVMTAIGNGEYGGLARDASIVLVDVGRDYVLADEDIVSGFKWFLSNHKKYDIKVIVTACDASESCLDLNDVVEELISQGVTVVAAAGNGFGNVSPPASSKNSIAVGGYYDGGDGLSIADYPHRKSLFKPTVLAPAVNMPIPILDAFEEKEIAKRYFAGDSTYEERVTMMRIISSDYKLVDGTSLSAPIVGSIVALMLQSNPSLTPAEITNILKDTSSAGVLRADKALSAI